MSKLLSCVSSMLMISLLSAASLAQEKPAATKADTAKTAAKKEEPKKKKKKKPGKPFDELVEGFNVIEGMFTLYQNENEAKVYMEIKPEQFDAMYMCSITREAGDGWFFDSSSMLNEFPFVLKKVGQKVQFVHKNVYFRADKDAALHRAVKRGVSDAIMGSTKIVSQPHPDRGSVLIDPTTLFVQDIARVNYIFSEFIKKPRFSFDKNNSYFSMLKSFPENTEIQVTLHYKTSSPRNVPTLADNGSFQHVYHYSLAKLPETSFKPRIADDRIGHFPTMYQDYTTALSETPYVRYINRWHLEKAEPRFKVSAPKKPIVFWIENTVPVEYRDAVRRGALLWNPAFEAVGFKDAIVVKQMPDDAEWDPADARYNTIRWIVQPGGGYAVGPSRTNPFTGEIYDADIRVSADFVRYLYFEHQDFTSPLAIGDSIAAAEGIYGKSLRGLCTYADGAAKQLAFGHSVLAARGAFNGASDLEAFINSALVDLIAHEVGHTLGLRHNFKASTLHSTDQLQDVNITTRDGLTASVMDYTPVNVAPKGQSQGLYHHKTVGTYDYWAIEYAYKPYDANSAESEKAMLEKIASKAADPRHTYGTDEDAFGGPRGIDPTANRWDMGANSIDWFGQRMDLSKEIWDNMEARFEKDGERYQRLRYVFRQAIGEYFSTARIIPKYIGGLYHSRDHIGDPNGRIPFRPVEVAKQKAALNLLTTRVLGPDAFSFSPDLLNKLAPERHWDFSVSVWNARRIEYPIHDVIGRIQSFPLNHCYDPIMLSRLIDNELRAEGGEKFTLPDMFNEIRSAVWAEVEAGQNINSFRRNLQRMHLKHLIRMVVKPRKGTPEDASTIARAGLITLQKTINGAMNGSQDAYTKAHLAESQARIASALDAGMQRQMTF